MRPEIQALYFGLISWLLASAVAGECSIEALRSLADASLQAFSKMDADQFEGSAAALSEQTACQAVVLSGADCARLHINRGLASFLADDVPATIMAFRAALDADPEVRLGEDVAPPGHPMLEQFRTAQQWSAARPTRPLPVPQTGWLAVDGQRAEEVPIDRPFVFQQVSDSGSVAATTYVVTGEPLPTYPARPPPPVVRRRSPKWLTGAGIAVGALAVGAWGGSFAARGAYNQAVESGDPDQIRRRYRLTNGLSAGAAAGLVAGAGLVVVGRL